MSALSVESTHKWERAIAVAILLIFMSSVFGFLQLSITPFLAYAVGGVFLVYLTTCVSRAAWLLPIPIASVLALCYHALGAPLGTAPISWPPTHSCFWALQAAFSWAV